MASSTRKIFNHFSVLPKDDSGDLPKVSFVSRAGVSAFINTVFPKNLDAQGILLPGEKKVVEAVVRAPLGAEILKVFAFKAPLPSDLLAELKNARIDPARKEFVDLSSRIVDFCNSSIEWDAGYF